MKKPCKDAQADAPVKMMVAGFGKKKASKRASKSKKK